MQIDVTNTNVFIACPCNRDFPWQTTLSLIESISALSWRHMDYKFQILTQGSQIDRDRSELAKEFLNSDCDRLFWIDSDMRFSIDDFFRILALSTKHDIIGASYPAKKEGGTEFLIEMNNLTVNSDEHGCIEVLGYGLGFCCVSRKVMEDCRDASPTFLDKGKPLTMVFRTGIDGEGVYRSEDMHFFKLCRSLGYRVMLDPTLELGHIGGYEYRGKLSDALQKVEQPVAVEA